jgi:ribosomal-protein-alanine N-acetyltransferase
MSGEPTAAAAAQERPLTAFDLELLAALHAGAFPDDPWSPRAFAELLAMPGAQGRLRHAQGTPCAFVLWRLAGPEMEILSIATAPAARRRGHAAALLRAALAAAGVERVLLEVADDNTAAQRLYAAQGFAAVARRPRYYKRAGGGWVDALLLECRPTSS